MRSAFIEGCASRSALSSACSCSDGTVGESSQRSERAKMCATSSSAAPLVLVCRSCIGLSAASAPPAPAGIESECAV